jgi:proto-oncogene tyrosine-protein kinase Ret
VQIDSKWEINRRTITLDSTIGEGEFGRVAKASVENLNNSVGFTTVAVKMLKGALVEHMLY